MFDLEGKWPNKVEQTGSTLGLSEIVGSLSDVSGQSSVEFFWSIWNLGSYFLKQLDFGSGSNKCNEV